MIVRSAERTAHWTLGQWTSGKQGYSSFLGSIRFAAHVLCFLVLPEHCGRSTLCFHAQSALVGAFSQPSRLEGSTVLTVGILPSLTPLCMLSEVELHCTTATLIVMITSLIQSLSHRHKPMHWPLTHYSGQRLIHYITEHNM